MRALVIDDASAMRELLRMMLEATGFEVQEAVDGQDGLERLAAMECPDLVLVDWNMPRMNGLQFVEALRADSAYDSARVMLVTSESQIDHVLSAIQAGANEYIMKPFTPESLRDKLTILGFNVETEVTPL